MAEASEADEVVEEALEEEGDPSGTGATGSGGATGSEAATGSGGVPPAAGGCAIEMFRGIRLCALQGTQHSI